MNGLIVAILCAVSVSFAAPEKIKLDPSRGQTEFVAVGRPAMLKISGKGQGPEGSVSIDGEKLSGEFSFKLDQLTTGIGLRDEHMKEKYLEVKKHPEAVLKIKSVSWPASGEGKVPFQGILALHGVEKPVEGTAEVARKEGGYQVKSSFQIKLSDFGVAIPTYAGLTVADLVNVSVQLDSRR